MKKALALALALSLLSSLALPASAAAWPAWAEDARRYGVEQQLSSALMSAPEAPLTPNLASQLLPGAAQGQTPLTRAEFAQLLYRQYGTPGSGNLLPYTDRDSIAPEAKDALKWCVSAGVLRGRSASILAPEATISVAEAITMVQRAQALPDLTGLRSDLAALTQAPRPTPSQGEAKAVSYLTRRLESLGYQVTTQAYNGGHNVIATTNAASKGDILVLSTHHDTVPTSFGAADNGSGVAALLLLAQMLQGIAGDTELRLISFTDEESGKNGSRHYVDSLPAEERQRMVGCIQLDMLGGLGSQGTQVCTTDGTSNYLSDLLLSQDSTLTLGQETGSDHAIFQLSRIPAVLVTQQGQGYLYHSAGDTSSTLNPWAIYQAAEAVAAVAKKMISPETASYQALAAQQAEHYIYRQSRQSRIFFSATRAENEAYLGFSGQLVEQRIDEGEFWRDSYDVYQYTMGWFGGDVPMTTQYTYRNGYLENVQIFPGENGYTTEQMVSLITATHGTPKKADAQSGSWDWEDLLYSKYISLNEVNGQPQVQVFSFSLGLGSTLATYDVTAGEASIDDPQHANVWELLCAALPVERRQNIGQFQLFTDGFSNILAYTATMGAPDQPDNTRFTISVDYYDVYDENGNPRDWSKLLFTLIHEYGHVLLENDTQIDLATGSDVHDPAGFIPGSFRQRYYEKFWQDPYSSYLGSYWETPGHYVSQYAGNMFHEDIADTFAVFVFADAPAGNGVAEEKLRFFWADADMVSLRAQIREGLGLN